MVRSDRYFFIFGTGRKYGAKVWGKNAGEKCRRRERKVSRGLCAGAKAEISGRRGRPGTRLGGRRLGGCGRRDIGFELGWSRRAERLAFLFFLRRPLRNTCCGCHSRRGGSRSGGWAVWRLPSRLRPTLFFRLEPASPGIERRCGLRGRCRGG